MPVLVSVPGCFKLKNMLLIPTRIIYNNKIIIFLVFSKRFFTNFRLDNKQTFKVLQSIKSIKVHILKVKASVLSSNKKNNCPTDLYQISIEI